MTTFKYIKSITSIGQLIVGISALFLVYFSFNISIDKVDAASNSTYKHLIEIFNAIFFLYAAGLIVDRLGAIAQSIAEERKDQFYEAEFKRLPTQIASNAGLVTFPSTDIGMKYCSAAVENAISVKNTILRYGSSESHSASDKIYTEWLEKKKKLIDTNKCPWREIISESIPNTSTIYSYICKFLKNPPSAYRLRKLDDVNSPMVQMTIIKYIDYSEIIIGWEFPGFPHGASALIRNSVVVEYFDNYFDHYWDLCKEDVKSTCNESPAPSPSS